MTYKKWTTPNLKRNLVDNLTLNLFLNKRNKEMFNRKGRFISGISQRQLFNWKAPKAFQRR